MKSKCSEALIVEKFDDPVMFVHVTPHVCDLSDIFSQPKTCVPLSKRPKHQLRRKNRIYCNNSIRSKKQRNHVGTRPYKCPKQTRNQRKQN